ncbi:MAG: phosphate signaling complex protein PhoU [Gammaproteobacteria bacterium]|nr:phosphate signaling complex protein PhoU [Gammaproteobacteria bacterium]
MDQDTLGHHISQRYDAELSDIRNKVLEMGGLVEQQLVNAVRALADRDRDLAETVVRSDYKVNAMEVAIDEECTHILARRQPAASDLRLLIAVIKTITDLERIGDEAERIGKMAVFQLKQESRWTPQVDLRPFGDRVASMLHGALDTFARLDVEQAIAVAREDINVDREYEGIVRQLITYMMEDPRSIPASLHLLWSARSMERIGDRSRNICEYVIYLVKGRDVRHTSLEKLEDQAREPR